MQKIKLIFLSLVFLLTFINTKAQFSGVGSGTETDPYQVSNATQLDELRNFLGTANSSKHFQLMNDIDLTELIATKYPDVGWLPIGNRSSLDNNAFYGSLQGNGFVIKNLWIARTGSNYLGLFGNIKNAIINNLNIQLASSGITGGNYVGAVSGLVTGGSVTNSQMSGTINAIGNVGGLIGSSASNTLIQNDSATAIVNSTGDNVGGLIGYSSSAISNSHSSGEVNISGDYSGGLAGYASAAISGCSSTSNVKNVGSVFVGNFMGGLVGANYAAVSNSNASGNVTGISTVGGLVGDSYAPISNSYATGNVSGQTWIGGLVGASDKVDNCYATGDVYADQKVGGGLVGQSYGTIEYSHASGNVSGSQSLGGLVGIMGATVSYSYATGNIDQTVPANMPEGGFLDYGGLAGSAFSSSFIENCFASGDVTVGNTAMYVGGLAGLTYQVTNSYAYGSVTGGYSLVGGLAGDAWGPISNSAAMNPSVKSSSNGNLNKVHRLVGEVEFDGEIINSYALENMQLNDQIITSGAENNLEGLNKSIGELQQQATYGNGLDWDFASVWKIREGHGYPYLQTSEYLTSIIAADINNKEWGTLTPKGILAVKDGSSQVFEITANSGYEIESVVVDNVNIGNPVTYDLSNITENHTVFVIFKQGSLNTNEFDAKNIKIYPNPTSDNIYVTGNKKISALELYNSNGQKVLQTGKGSMNISTVTDGIYILKIVTENGEVSTSKIIKK